VAILSPYSVVRRPEVLTALEVASRAINAIARTSAIAYAFLSAEG